MQIQDCLEANGSDTTITIDGVTIDLDSSALTPNEIATAIATADFNSGNTQSSYAYAVSSNAHGQVIFTLTNPVDASVNILISDAIYSKGICTALTSCPTDTYRVGYSCMPVGEGYYSANIAKRSLRKKTCNSGNTPTNGRFTGSGSGTDNCPFACDLGYHKDGNAYSCISNIDNSCSVQDGVQRRWNPSLSGGNGGWESCVIMSCDVDFHLSSNACVAVAEGKYSLANSLTEASCNTKPSHSQYTGSGNGANNCSWACDEGYYLLSGACKLTPTGEWSGEKDNQKQACNASDSGKSSGNIYSHKGETSSTCRVTSPTQSCSAGVINGVATGTRSWSVTNKQYEGACVLSSCAQDYAANTESTDCVSVGDGYYSVDSGNASLQKVACNGGSISNGRFTSSGRGRDTCDFECNSNYHKDGSIYGCVSDKKSCSLADGTGELTWDGSAWGTDCVPITCGEDFYKNGNACESVGDGQYSPSSGRDSLQAKDCTNKRDHSQYTGSGSGTNNCPWACDAGYYKLNGACEPTPTGEYSEAKEDGKKLCNGIPQDAVYVHKGETTGDCAWKCGTGYLLSGGLCINDDGSLAGRREHLNLEPTYTSATLTFQSFWDGGRFDCSGTPIYPESVFILNADGTDSGFFVYHRGSSGKLNIAYEDWVKRLLPLLTSKLGLTDPTFEVKGTIQDGHYTNSSGRLQFTAPSNTGADWNGKRVKMVSSSSSCTLTIAQEYDGWRGNVKNFVFPGSFSGGVTSYETATLEITDCLAASATDASITVDGVSIDLVSSALTAEEIAAAIAATTFSTDGDFYQDHPYTVTADGATVTFTLTTPLKSRPPQILINDSTYTKGASCSSSSTPSS